MDTLDGFSVEQGRAIYRPKGTVSFEEATDLLRGAIEAARSQQVAELLVDTTALFGFASPSTAERFFAVVGWVNVAERRLRLAIVARDELIDPQKFGVTVGRNRDLNTNIFPTESEAVDWLVRAEQQAIAQPTPLRLLAGDGKGDNLLFAGSVERPPVRPSDDRPPLTTGPDK